MATRRVSYLHLQHHPRLIREHYLTEVGQGIKASGVKREEIFLTTKLDNPDQTRAKEALLQSLKKLDTPYLDLCASIYDRD
jgi:aryl-alcohol dehydrogenase-like predicted oxidoreductase